MIDSFVSGFADGDGAFGCVGAELGPSYLCGGRRRKCIVVGYASGNFGNGRVLHPMASWRGRGNPEDMDEVDGIKLGV